MNLTEAIYDSLKDDVRNVRLVVSYVENVIGISAAVDEVAELLKTMYERGEIYAAYPYDYKGEIIFGADDEIWFELKDKGLEKWDKIES